MAFFNRALWVIAVMTGAPMFTNIDAALKPTIFITGVALLVALVAWVSVFAWLKPKNLLYRAETHFEEWRFSAENSGAGSTERVLPPPPPPQDAPR